MSAIKNLIKTFLPHRKEYYHRRFFRRLSPRKFSEFLRSLGVQPGDVVFTQIAFSKLGYFAPGPDGFIQLLHETVGEKGTLAMPSFTFDGSMQDFVATNPAFDVVKTPSKVGFVTERFRQYPGVRRSIHPTHSICALGDRAEELVAGHERCDSPCGVNSPLGKLAGMNGKMLRLGTGSLTLYHHVQELVEFPNLFLPDAVHLPCKTYSGETIAVPTRVYRKQIPNMLILGEDTDIQKLSIHPSNFPLLYSGNREEHLRQDSARQAVLVKMLDIRNSFETKGHLKKGAINGCQCELFEIAPYIELAVKLERELLDTYRERYELSKLEQLFQAGKYPSK